MENPLVSVIIPAYNAQKYLHGCITSALRQSYRNVEVVIVDDGSTDRTAEIVRSLMLKHTNLHLHWTEGNTGPYNARFEGIRHCAGKYIMFLDADDSLHPKAVEKLYQCIRSTGSDIAVMGAKYSFMGGLLKVPFSIPSRAYKHQSYDKQGLMTDIMPQLVGKRGVTCSMCDKMYSHHLFDNIDFIAYNGRCGEDLAFNMQIFPRAKRLAVTDFSGYRWRYNGANLKYSTRMWDDLQQTYPVLHTLIEATRDTDRQWQCTMHKAVEMSRLSDLQEAVIQRMCIMKQPETEILKFITDYIHDVDQQHIAHFCECESDSLTPEQFLENCRIYFRNHRNFYNFMRFMKWLSC